MLDASDVLSNSLSDLPKSLIEKISQEETEGFILEPYTYLDITPPLSAKSNKKSSIKGRDPLEGI